MVEVLTMNMMDKVMVEDGQGDDYDGQSDDCDAQGVDYDGQGDDYDVTVKTYISS